MLEPKGGESAKKAGSRVQLMSKIKNKLSSRSRGEFRRDAQLDSTMNKVQTLPSESTIERRAFNHDNVEASPEAICQVASVSAPIRKLWSQAYDELQVREPELMNKYEATLLGNVTTAVASTTNIGREDQMMIVLKSKVEEVEQNMWKLRFGSNEVPVQDLMAPLISIIDWANDYITAALSSNPYGSIAWAGVSLLLPLLLNPSKQAASLAKSLEYISGLLVQSSMREDLYSRRYELKESSQGNQDYLPSHKGYRDTLKELYIHIMRLQAASVCYYSKHSTSRVLRDIIKWDEWDTLFESIETQEAAFQSVNELFKDTKYEEDCLVSERRHWEGMKRLETIGLDVSGIRQAVEKAEMDTQRRGLLNWLSSIDPSENYNSARDTHESETSKWLVEDNIDFRNWKIADNSFLWLHGKAGSGKSVLSSSIIKHLQDLSFSDPCTAIGFFYLSFSDAKKQETVGMLESLIKQLCCRRPDTPQSLIDLGRYKEQGHRPDMKTLETTLAATMQGFSRVYIVIDALDECPSRDGERKKLLECLRRIHAAKLINLHLLCTSRRETDIETGLAALLAPPAGVAIDLSEYNEAVSKDISLYIDQTLRTPDYETWPENIKVDARMALISKADGMFQYVSCQFDALRGLSSVSDVQKALDSLPENLDSTYDRMLEQIDARYVKQVAAVLIWLAFSMRPLYLHEIAEIFILDHELSAPLDEKRRLFRPEEVLKHLPSLISTIQIRVINWESVWNGADVIEIQFAHFSIKEYLISGRMNQYLVPKFSFTGDAAHLQISSTCLAYHLQLSSLLATKSEVKRFPLWEYAVWYWAGHLEQVDRASWTDSVTERALELLRPGGQSLQKAFRIYGEKLNQPYWGTALDVIPLPLYYVACLRAFQLSELLLSNGAETKKTGRYYGSPLCAAASGGTMNIVQLLLDHGVDVNADDGIHGTALYSAASSGHTNICRLLLDYGADINASREHYGTALHGAAIFGKTSDIKLLLDRGANINATGGAYGTALQAAATFGVESTAQLLLNEGADVDAQGGEYGNALLAAVSHGWDVIVERLLDRGADINMRGGEFGSALQTAIGSNYTNLIPLLVSRGAKLDPPGEEWEELLASLRWDARNRLRRYQENPTRFVTGDCSLD